MDTFVTVVKCSSLRKKDCIIIKYQPYKIKSISGSKMGERTKICLSCINLLTKNKYTDIYLGTDMVLKFRLKEKDYKVLSMDSNILKCLDENNIKADIFLDEKSEMYNNIKKNLAEWNITISTRFLPTENDIVVCLDTNKIQLYLKDDEEKYIKCYNLPLKNQIVKKYWSSAK